MKAYNNTLQSNLPPGLNGKSATAPVLTNGNGNGTYATSAYATSASATSVHATKVYAARTTEMIVTAADGSSVPFQPLTNVIGIGRSAENEIVLNDHNVSRRHAQLERRHDGWYISDLDSTNGSYLGKTPLIPFEPVKWLDNQVLHFGQCQLEQQPETVLIADESSVDHKTMVMRVPVKPTEPVNPEPQRIIHIVAGPTQAELLPDAPVRMQVVITNEGTDADRFVIGCLGLPNSWVRMPSRPILLDAGQSKTIPVLVQPAHISYTKPGIHKFRFSAHAVSNPMPVKSAECQIKVGTYNDVSLSFKPKDVREGENIQILMRNDGNTTAVYKLSAECELEKIDFRGERRRLLLQAGANEVSNAQLKLIRRHWIGRKQSVPFVLKMDLENGETLSAPGRITSAPVFPWYWFVAMIGIICGGVWWMFLA